MLLLGKSKKDTLPELPLFFRHQTFDKKGKKKTLFLLLITCFFSEV